MLVANLAERNTTAAVGLTQWDFGQILRITGLNIIDRNIIEVHFALEGEREAPIVIGQVVNGDINVDIPDNLLKDGRSISAYVYLSSETKGETIKKIYLKVAKRAKPVDYVEPEHEDMFRETIEEVDRLVGEAKDIVKKTVDNMDESTKSEIADRVFTEAEQNEAKTGDVVEMLLRHNMLNALITNKRILCSRNKILMIY